MRCRAITGALCYRCNIVALRSSTYVMTPQQSRVRHALLTAAHMDFSKGLGAHAFFKVHSDSVSADLVQDTYIKTWAYLVKGGKIVTMKAFLYHTLNNLIIDHYRKKKNASLDVLLEKGFNPKDESSESLIDMLDGKAALVLIMRLPVAYQKIMRMRYVQDLTLEEMSLITGSSKNALAVKVHRGLEKLRALYRLRTSIE